jgi:16S rRNA C967 or C1407 C5-methylase (RsmB/RsmF family)
MMMMTMMMNYTLMVRYPGGLAWQLRLSRTDIRRSEPLYRLHNFLVAETAAGGVSRQEAVSMIPPVVLDVQPHHKVSGHKKLKYIYFHT